MSEFESRPQVTAVTGVAGDAALRQANSAGSAILAAAAAVAAAAVVGTLRAAIAAHGQMEAKARPVSGASRRIQQSPITVTANPTTIGVHPGVPMNNVPVAMHTVNPGGIVSATSIPAIMTPEYRRQMQKMTLEKAKVSTLAEIATSNLLIRDAHSVQQGVSAILQAGTVEEVQAQSVVCERAIRQQHQGLLQEACAAVYENSMAQIGFTQIDRIVATAGVIRTIGIDVRGRTLVNEISLRDGEVAAQSEVLGVGDNTCSEVLDDLGSVLDRNGLQSADPSRKSTGGQCHSLAALEYAQKGKTHVYQHGSKSRTKVGLK